MQKLINLGHRTARGFTLIELLVVIAIIGILAGIVLASLGNARSGGKDAAVQEQMASARAQAELFYGSNTNYTTVCSSGTNNILALLNASVSASGVSGGATLGIVNAAGAYNKVTCYNTATAWAAEAPLSASVSATPSMWCVDSTGASKKNSTNLAASATNC